MKVTHIETQTPVTHTAQKNLRGVYIYMKRRTQTPLHSGYIFVYFPYDLKYTKAASAPLYQQNPLHTLTWTKSYSDR